MSNRWVATLGLAHCIRFLVMEDLLKHLSEHAFDCWPGLLVQVLCGGHSQQS
jgi:hypothetical protein